ncbi:MAG: M14 family metallocarboxypeptidase [Opitutales bacterium]
MAYTGEPLNLPETLQRVEALDRCESWQLETYGSVDRHPLYVLTRNRDQTHGHLYLSTGIHGDEPAGPLATLRLLEQGALSPRLNWTIFPLLNPLGLLAGTRENAAGADLNRDYAAFSQPEARQHRDWLAAHCERYSLALALHEDWESHGFYIYQLNLQPDAPSLGRGMLDVVEPICGVDRSASIEGREASDGLIAHPAMPEITEDCPEQFYLQQNHTRHGYTLEAPSDQPLERRVDALCAAVLHAQARLLDHLAQTAIPGINQPGDASDAHEAI